MDTILRGAVSGGQGLLADGSDAPLLSGTMETSPLYALQREIAPTLGGKKPKPSWWALYAVLPLTVLLFLLADQVPAMSTWRTVSELFASLVILGAIALWMRVNRLALILADSDEHSGGVPDLL